MRLYTLGALTLAMAQCIFGNTLYSDLGPGDSYQSIPWGGSGASGGNYMGFSFVASGSGSLNSILVPFASVGALPASVQISLYADSSSAPGLLLETWTALLSGNPIHTPNQTIPLLTLTSIENPILTAGQEYWLIVAPTLEGVGYAANSQGVPGNLWFGFNLGSLQKLEGTALAMRIEGVPEPGSLTLFGVGGVSLMALGCIRRAAIAKAGRVGWLSA
jgi:hypothetical protein